jgi:hypothetical protein
MNSFAYPTGFPNGASFSGTYENVQNYQTIIIDYHTNSTDILTVHYSNDTISDYYTTNYTISNQQLQFVLNPSYTFFKLSATGTGTAARYCKCRYYTEISGNSSNTIVNTTLEGTNPNNVIVPIAASSQNSLCVEINGSNSAFGDILTTSMTQVFSNTFIYGLNTNLVTTVNQGGATSVSNNILSCSTTTNGNISTVRSRQYVKYAPGIGVAIRFAAIFSDPTIKNTSIMGLGTPECGVFFGTYGNGAHNKFSTIVISNAKKQIVTMNVTKGSTNAVALTVILGGISYYPINIITCATSQDIAYNIAKADYSGTSPGWTASSSGTVITFVCIETGPQTGTYDIALNTTPGAWVNQITTLQLGTVGTNTIITQDSWNIDKMDGNGPSGMILDPTQGNVYWIKYQYLGFGQITFGVEDSNTGKLIPVNAIKYTNSNTAVSLSNPSMPFMMSSINTSNIQNIIQCASYAAFIEGNPGLSPIIQNYQYNASFSGTKPIFSLRVVQVFNLPSTTGNSLVNQATISPLSINVSNNTTMPLILTIIENCTLDTAIFIKIPNLSVVEYDTTATTIKTQGITRLSICVAAGTNQIVNLTEYNIICEPGSILSVQGTMNNAADINNIAAIAIQWAENQ